MSHAKRKPKPKDDNLFDQLKVQEFALFESPVDDAGAAFVFRFEDTVELDGDTFAFPLNGEQMVRLVRLANGWAGKQGLKELHQAERLVKMPHEL